MRVPMRSALIVAAVIAVGASSAGAQGMAMGKDRMAMGKGMKMSSATMQRMMRGWPKASKDATMDMMKKYGAPLHMNEHMAMWGPGGGWKRTVVYNYEVDHQFPGAHTDVMQQWVNYRVPVGKFSDLAMYDGSVVAERTNGELSARCDKEAANYLAVNLAHEIVTGARTAADARRMYGEQIMKMKAGQSAPYTERLMFTPAAGGTADPDHP